MPVESAQYIDTLQPDWPLGTEPESAGDDHLRMIKQVLQNTFPALAGAVTPSQDSINGTVNGMRWRADSQGDSGRPDNMAATIQDGSTYAPIYAAGVDVKVANTDAAVLLPWGSIRDLIWPVGSIYANQLDVTDPSIKLGFGTWERLGGYFYAGGVAVYDQNGYVVGWDSGQNAAKSGNGYFRVQNAHIVTANLPASTDMQGGHIHNFSYSTYGTNNGHYGDTGYAGTATTAYGQTDNQGTHNHNTTVTMGAYDTVTGIAYQAPMASFNAWVRTA